TSDRGPRLGRLRKGLLLKDGSRRGSALTDHGVAGNNGWQSIPEKGGRSMATGELHETAKALVCAGKGILAADESTGTIKKRFDAIGVESTDVSRRDYRELLFRTEDAMHDYISGVILYEETLYQNAADSNATPLVELIE